MGVWLQGGEKGGMGNQGVFITLGYEGLQTFI